MKINAKRVEHRLKQLGKIGRDNGGGWTRFSFTEEDREARQLIISYMEEASLRVRVDAAGNIFGRREGTQGNVPAIASGSHIDTVKNGGLFDGNTGVICALEVAQTLEENRVIHAAPFEVIVFTEEEGGRFGSSLFGSRALAGEITQDYLKACKDKDGITQWDAMKSFGLHPENIFSARIDKDYFGSFFELHIEQGEVLERNNETLGVVEGIVGITWLDCSIRGKAGHAGATPMDLRFDALSTAAEIILAIEQAAYEAGPTAVATVGHLSVFPSSINVIPGEVNFSVDIRDLNQEVIDGLVKHIQDKSDSIASKRGLGFQCKKLLQTPPTRLSCECIDHLVEKIRDRDISYRLMPSGAGHDAQVMTKITDVGMIFVPSKGGVSHNPMEDTDWDDISQGAQILYDVVVDRLCLR
ncbi:MAG TPA: Zn-dependent hydrolase [Clostridia bacterium]|nr:Zn-dependent hydrolase [Clostridia bacterium]